MSVAAREALMPLKEKAQKVEARVQKLNETLEKLDAALAEPGLFENNLPRATKLTKERAALLSAIETSESAWLEALENLEQAQE